MALTDFFRINLPYGIQSNEKNEWSAFNREYLPLGWNDKERNKKEKDVHQVFTKYKGITENSLTKIIPNEKFIHRDKEGKITKVFFYNDATNPKSNPEHWEQYFRIIKSISKFEIKSK